MRNLNNATITSLNNSAETEIISAAANVNGIKLRYASLCSGNSQDSYIEFDGKRLANARLWSSSHNGAVFVPEMILPAGAALKARANGSDSYVCVAVELL